MHTQTFILWQSIFHFIEFLNMTFRYFVGAVLGTAVHKSHLRFLGFFSHIPFRLHKTKTANPKPSH